MTKNKQDEFDEFFKDGPGMFLKFEDGETTKLRVLTNFVIGWEGWYNNKPVRFPADHKWTSEELNTLDIDDNNHPKRKQFMACVVYNYNLKSFQIWEITQKTIRNSILSLRLDEDWGGLDKHDLKITRKGKGFDTEYTVIPSPGSLPKEVDVKENKLDPKMLLTDDKNKTNVAEFQKDANSDKNKELDPNDSPF